MIQIDNILISYKGDHTGLGSITFNDVAVVAMGPHYFPLGELSRFGIYRDGDDFSDIEESKTRVWGWTKLVAGDRSFGSGATWIQFSAEKKEDEILLHAGFENGKGEDPFAFVFFVKAEEVRIADKRYVKGGLSHFQGLGTSVELVMGQEKISLQSETKMTMQIIPLAGGDYFWGADFLIAFEVEELSRHYTWKLKALR